MVKAFFHEVPEDPGIMSIWSHLIRVVYLPWMEELGVLLPHSIDQKKETDIVQKHLEGFKLCNSLSNI